MASMAIEAQLNFAQKNIQQNQIRVDYDSATVFSWRYNDWPTSYHQPLSLIQIEVILLRVFVLIQVGPISSIIEVIE